MRSKAFSVSPREAFNFVWRLDIKTFFSCVDAKSNLEILIGFSFPGLGSSDQPLTSASSGSNLNSGGGHYKRNPTTFVPYITGPQKNLQQFFFSF